MKPIGVRLCRPVLALLLVLALLTMIACGGGEERAAQQEGQAQFAGTIKIGAVVDITGPGGGLPTSMSMVRGTEKAVEDINAKGGIMVGGQRYRLELIKLDTRSEAVTAVAAAQQIIQEGAIGMLNASTAFFDQAYQQANAAGLITWTASPAGLNRAQFEGPEKHPMLFATIDFAEPIVVGWFKQISKQFPEIRRVGFLGDDGPLGRSLSPAAENATKEIGAEFVGALLYPRGTTDFSTYITNMRSRRADLVYAPGMGVEGAVQVTRLRMAPYVILPGLRPIDVQKVGDVGDTTLLMVDFRLPYHKELAPPEYVPIIEGFGHLEGGMPVQPGYTIAGYDFVLILAKAIEKAGTVKDPKVISQALIGTTVDSIMGGKTGVDPDHAARGPTGLVVVTKDKYTVHIYRTARDDIPEKTYSVPR